jgi:hypothetical protein
MGGKNRPMLGRDWGSRKPTLGYPNRENRNKVNQPPKHPILFMSDINTRGRKRDDSSSPPKADNNHSCCSSPLSKEKLNQTNMHVISLSVWVKGELEKIRITENMEEEEPKRPVWTTQERDKKTVGKRTRNHRTFLRLLKIMR